MFLVFAKNSTFLRRFFVGLSFKHDRFTAAFFYSSRSWQVVACARRFARCTAIIRVYPLRAGFVYAISRIKTRSSVSSYLTNDFWLVIPFR